MVRKFFTYTLILLGSLFSWAQKKEYCLKIGEFTEFTVADNINVTYKSSADSAGYATFWAPENAVSSLTFSCNKNKLKIQFQHDNPQVTAPAVTIYSLALSKATNWGDSTITIARINPGTEFKANVVGNGEIVARDIHCTKVDASVKAGMGHIFLTGKAQSAKYELVSAGAIEAAQLDVANLKAVMMGSGNIDCSVSESLTVVGAGSGHVYYIGSPESIKNRSIGVKIEKVEE